MTQDGVFIRALWGDRQIALFDMIRDECREVPPKFDIKFVPEIWYAFGEDNRKFLESCGYTVRMVSPHPVVPLGTGRRNPECFGLWAWGKSIWVHKLWAIRKACEEFGDCVWIDADCGIRKPLPPDFWPMIRSGAAVRTPLFYTVHREAHWRPERADQHYVNMGRWCYWRGVETVDAVLRIADQFPKEEDQRWTARYIDSLMDGWKGPEAYEKAGFQMPLLRIGHWAGNVFKKKDEWCVESHGVGKLITHAYLFQLLRGIARYKEVKLAPALAAYKDWVAACKEADPTWTPREVLKDAY